MDDDDDTLYETCPDCNGSGTSLSGWAICGTCEALGYVRHTCYPSDQITEREENHDDT